MIMIPFPVCCIPLGLREIIIRSGHVSSSQGLLFSGQPGINYMPFTCESTYICVIYV